MPPSKADENVKDIRQTLEDRADKLFVPQQEFKDGQKVRLKVDRGRFEKGYTQRWSSEVYTVVNVVHPIYDRAHARYVLDAFPSDALFTYDELLPVKNVESSMRRVTRSRMKEGSTLKVQKRSRNI